MKTDFRRHPRRTDTSSPITAARIAAGLTQSQLAERVGVHSQQIGAWERGERNPKLDALLKISQALGCSIDELIK